MNGGPVTAMDVASSVGWTLLHSLWQALSLWIAVTLFRGRVGDPRLRSRAADIGLALLLFAQAVTFSACLVHVADLPLPWQAASSEVELNKLGMIRRPSPLVGGWTGDTVARLDPWMPWLVGGWCTWSVLRIARYARAARVAARMLTIAPELPETLLDACRRIAARLGVRRRVRFVALALAEGPGTIGWLRPCVFIPPALLLSMPPAELEAIVTHELAHVVRQDYASAALRLIVESIYSANPFVAWVVAAANVDAEECCDAIATAHVGDPIAYARALSSLADRVIASRMAVHAAGGSLTARVAAILRPPVPMGRRTLWGRVIGASATAIILLLVTSMAIAAAAARQRELRWLEERTLGEAVREILDPRGLFATTPASTRWFDPHIAGASKLLLLATDDRSAASTLKLTHALSDPATYWAIGIGPRDRDRLMQAVAFDNERANALIALADSNDGVRIENFGAFATAFVLSPVAQSIVGAELPRDGSSTLRDRLTATALAETTGRYRAFLDAPGSKDLSSGSLVLAAGPYGLTTRPVIIRRIVP